MIDAVYMYALNSALNSNDEYSGAIMEWDDHGAIGPEGKSGSR